MALTNRPVFTDQRTKDKINLHLRDIDDKITEEDIENVETDVTKGRFTQPVDKDALEEADKILQEKAEQDRSREDGNNTNEVQTPWNMLD